VTVVLWILVLALLVALVVLQVAGVRALRSWGVQPSRVVIALRIVNVVVVICAVALVFWRWIS